jgi:hypothetical protein
MKRSYLLFLLILAYSCKKNDDTYTSQQSFRDVMYWVTTTDTLNVTLTRQVYTSNIHANINKDTILPGSGSSVVYQIPATVLKDVKLFAQSFKNGNFHLEIKDKFTGELLGTGAVTKVDSNQLHPDYWTSVINIIP